MKAVKLFVIGGTLGVLLLIPLRMYGTLNPCGWLKIELKQAMTQKATQINTTSDAGAVGAMLHSDKGCVSLGMLKDRTLLLNTVPQNISANDTPKSLPNWYGSQLMSLSPDQRRQRCTLGVEM